MILRINNLSKQFGSKILFKDGELILHEGDKCALIGQNGTGKSTLINCIAGEEEFEGIIELNKNLKVSIMLQERQFEKSERTFLEYLKEKYEFIEKRKKQYELEIGNPKTYEDMTKLGKIMQEYELLCTRVVERIEESKIKKILGELKFEMEEYNKRIIDLSGGQRTKLRLAECLCKDTNLLILDEPTNHLDFETLRWLEDELTKTKATLLIVSHDRYFISKIINKVVEIENNKFQVYVGNYEHYVDERLKHLAALEHKFQVVTKEKKRLLDSAKEKREWASIQRSKKLRILADRIERRAEELPEVYNPKEFIQIFKIDFEESIIQSNDVFTLKNVKKSFNDFTIFENVNFEVHKGEKIAIIGKNGSGKSTLIKILGGFINPDSGEIKSSYNVKVGYFDQELKNINLNQKVIDFFANSFANMQIHELISLAIQSGFPKDKLKNKLNTLSGGEKARLNLVRLMTEKSNVLLLDEPTNNLDIELIEALEKALIKYKGTIILISHDRYFLDKMATNLLIINNKEIKHCLGNYSSNFG